MFAELIPDAGAAGGPVGDGRSGPVRRRGGAAEARDESCRRGPDGRRSHSPRLRIVPGRRVKRAVVSPEATPRADASVGTMTPSSPRLVAVVAVVVLAPLAAGCLAGAPDPGTTPTATGTGTGTGTEPPAGTTTPSATGTATPGGHEHAANQPDPDKAVRLVNEYNRSVTARVRVLREATNATVHDGTYDLAPGADRTVYDTAAADPDGVESFTVVVTARNATERVTVETSVCYGDVTAQVRPDGSLYVFYAIC